MRHTAQRISKILDGRQRRVTSVWKPALGALTFFVILGAAGVDHIPQLVGFKNSRPAAQIASSSDTQTGSIGHVVPAVARVNPSEPAFMSQAWRPMVTRAIQKKTPAGNDSRMISQASLPIRPQNVAFPGRPDVNLRPYLANGAHVINALAKQKTAPAFMLVVFQTHEYDNSGNVVVRTYMWRIPMPAQTGLDPRST
jgi:hypothetical protein